MAILKSNTQETTIISSCDPNINTIGGFNRVFFSVPGFYFDTVTLFESSAQWETDITAESIYQLDKVKEVIDQSEAPVYVKSGNGQQVLIRPGRIIHQYNFEYSNDFHKVLMQFDQNQYEVFLSDRQNNIYGTTDDETTVRGYRVNVLNVQKRMIGTNQKIFSILRIEYADYVEFDKFNVISSVAWMRDGLVTT
ncbi:hypothetical protein KAR91_38965 [Candidatus Pacearchaeota archaeon]|nr:hypothetical protein [Candidatus Pacearchaeota archaeon]